MNQREADEVAEAIRALNRAGWTIGDMVVVGLRGRVWIVTGRNGENQIRAEGETELAAWREALGQARAVGMPRK